MRSGDRPGLQNRRAAGHPVAGGFDPHSLPPFFNNLALVPAVHLPLSAKFATFPLATDISSVTMSP
jgi:hypothetical protein